VEIIALAADDAMT